VKLRWIPAILAAWALLAPSAGFGAATTVREPAFGLPHIHATTDVELSRENGKQIARDRLGQMMLVARVGRGTLYQVFGLSTRRSWTTTWRRANRPTPPRS
jgi:acyl-homoserine lactone acylase PvdQ